MPHVELSDLSLDELKALEKDVAKAIKSYEARQKSAALAAADAAAKELGFSLAELTGKKSKAVSVPKYRHPENPELTWTGRGRKPAWFVVALTNGTSADDLLIG